MSNLRIIGLIIGMFGLFLTLKIYRGAKWKRLNFVLFGLFSISIIAVSLYPDMLNTIAGILALHPEQRGRILTLLILTNILLWFLLLAFKTKIDKYAYQFDLLIRNLGYEESSHILEDKIVNKEIAVIIPAFNEVESLKELLKRMPEELEGRKLIIVVIDDGSTDNTAQEVEKAGFLVVRNKINRGQGAASRMGYDVLLKHSNIKVGVTMDADGQHLPEEINKLVKPILEDKYDLIIGSRILGKRQKDTFLRNTGISLFSKIINFLSGLKLTDCSSGFKAFNVDKMRTLNLREEQFQAAEVIIEAAKKGLRISEVPITILERKWGKTNKGKDWKYGIYFAKTIIKSWWRKI